MRRNKLLLEHILVSNFLVTRVTFLIWQMERMNTDLDSRKYFSKESHHRSSELLSGVNMTLQQQEELLN